MILIEKVTYRDTFDDSEALYYSLHGSSRYPQASEGVPVQPESIQGVRYDDGNGVVKVIGLTRQAREAIGIIEQSAICRNNEIISLTNWNKCMSVRLVSAQDKIKSFESAGFWSRFKWLFLGIGV